MHQDLLLRDQEVVRLPFQAEEQLRESFELFSTRDCLALFGWEGGCLGLTRARFVGGPSGAIEVDHDGIIRFKAIGKWYVSDLWTV